MLEFGHGILRRKGVLLYASQEEHVRKAFAFLHSSPSLSRFDPWSWERPSLWGLVDRGWGSVRVTGEGWGRGAKEEGKGEVVIVSMVTAVKPLFAL
jgi:hypothetical protein